MKLVAINGGCGVKDALRESTLFDAYYREYIDAVQKSNDSKAVLFAVKMLNSSKKQGINRALQTSFDMYHLTVQMIGELTPSELTMLFPIKKNYDGHRYQSKDYFFTRSMIDELGWDEAIANHSDGVFGFLWDYYNQDLSFFLIEYVSLMSDMDKEQGGRGFLEGWLEDNDIPVYTMHVDANGKEYMIDSDGNSFKVKKPRAKHLQIVGSV